LLFNEITQAALCFSGVLCTFLDVKYWTSAVKISVSIVLSFACTQAHAFSYEDLVTIIQGKNLQRIEDVLPQLPEEFRSSYTLMYQSRSLQDASYLNPRAILFGDDAELTCAFNGDSSQKGFDTLECFQFRADVRLFDFRQIQFPTQQNGLKSVLFSASGKSADGKVSCSACHSADTRPNWDSYPNWPGVYGSDDDDLSGTEESLHYLDFVKKRDQDPRYRYLIQDSDPNAPYLNNYLITGRPNLRFASFTSRMTALRSARILKTQAKQSWQDLAFAVGSLACTFTADEKQQLLNAGLNPDFNTLELDAFQETGLKSGAWSTQIFSDPETNSIAPAFEHYPGYGYFSSFVGTAVLFERAKTDSVLSSDFSALSAYLTQSYSGPEASFFDGMNAILPAFAGEDAPPPDPGNLCSEAKRLLLEESASR
jgi:hypothetical protein